MRFSQRSLAIWIFLILLLGCSMVATQTAHLLPIQEKVAKRNFAEAAALLDENSGHFTGKDRLLFFLDKGMLCHYAGHYAESNFWLNQAEQSMEELFTKSVTRAALSMLLNDNSLEYAGEDYEDIYINVFKALNYLHLQQFDEAFVEVRRIDLKLSMLERKYDDMAHEYNSAEGVQAQFQPGTSRFHNDVLGRYLSMCLYLAERKMDDARIDYEKIQRAFQTQSHIYDFAKPEITHPETIDEQPRLRLFGFAGKGPRKYPVTRYITTFKDYIVITGTSPETFNQVIPWPVSEGYHFKFSLPMIQAQPSDVAKIQLVVDGQVRAEGKLIEDLGQVAISTFEVKAPLIYLKSVTRSVVKGLIAEQSKAKIKEKNTGFMGDLLSAAVDVGTDLTENADLRQSHFFPGKAFVVELPLAEGEYNLQVRYVDEIGQTVFVDSLGTYAMEPEKIHFAESFFLK